MMDSDNLNTSSTDHALVGAQLFARYIVSEDDFIKNSAKFIENFCKAHLKKLESHSQRLQDLHINDEGKLTQLAGKVKYIRAYIELAQCYGKQLGIMTEAHEFQNRAAEYMGLAYAELQALECK